MSLLSCPIQVNKRYSSAHPEAPGSLPQSRGIVLGGFQRKEVKRYRFRWKTPSPDGEKQPRPRPWQSWQMYRNYPWTRARTILAVHPVSCFRDVDENARSGHPPIIFIMKASRREEGWRWRRGWEWKTEKQAEIHLVFGGDLGVSVKKDQDSIDVLRVWNWQLFFPP